MSDIDALLLPVQVLQLTPLTIFQNRIVERTQRFGPSLIPVPSLSHKPTVTPRGTASVAASSANFPRNAHSASSAMKSKLSASAANTPRTADLESSSLRLSHSNPPQTGKDRIGFVGTPPLHTPCRATLTPDRRTSTSPSTQERSVSWHQTLRSTAPLSNSSSHNDLSAAARTPLSAYTAPSYARPLSRTPRTALKNDF